MKQDSNTKARKSTSPDSEHSRPAVGVQTPVRNCRRLINIIIERKCIEGEYFSLHVVMALREYADAIEYQATYFDHADPEIVKKQEAKNLGQAIHKFKSSNECYVRVIAGIEED